MLKELADGCAKDKNFTEAFVKKASKLVKVKSLAGLGVILPLAISAQPFNKSICQKFII